MILLNGKTARTHYTSLLKEKVRNLSLVPRLIVIQIGDRMDSNTYIKAKKSFGLEIGVDVNHAKLDERVTEKEVLDEIKKHNQDEEVRGIIVQLPLPEHLNSTEIINAIDSAKDIDGLT